MNYRIYAPNIHVGAILLISELEDMGLEFSKIEFGGYEDGHTIWTVYE